MRCRDAREWLSAQRDGDRLEPSQISVLQEHLADCSSCRAFEQHERHMESLFAPSPCAVKKQATPQVRTSSISTDQIMRAVQQQKQITAQLEDIRQQQLTRFARMRKASAVGAALSFLIVSSVPLLFLIVMILQTDLAIKTLSLLNDAIDTGVVLGEYLQDKLIFITRNNLLLSGLAFIVVVMMGMWLRLMRTPKEA